MFITKDGNRMQTEDPAYAARLSALQAAWWKRIVDVQRPYRWFLERQDLGRTLDVGCGIGRNLKALPAGSIGVDHNATSVETARRAGLQAMTPDEFLAQSHEPFDGLLLAHVIEHMPPNEAASLLRTYLEFVRPGGKVLMICPQERGFASDPTHCNWTTGEDLVGLAAELGLVAGRPRSFPLPRIMGRLFTYNEFVLVAHKPE